jgi:DNA-binding transcriptional LysR family regulator
MPGDLQIAQLRALATVARLGSYVRAAEELSYTEPAVYLQVKGLEKSLGMALVRRAGHRVSLTSDGVKLLPYALDILDRVATMDQAVRGLRGNHPVVVATGRHTGVSFLIPAVAAFRKLNPQAEVEVHIIRLDQMVRAVIDGSADVAISGGLAHGADAELRLKHRLVLVPWVSYSLALVGAGSGVNGAGPDLLSLARSLPVLVPDYGGDSVERMRAQLVAAYPADWRINVIESAEAVKTMVENGLGLTLIPSHSVAKECAAGLLRILLTVNPATTTYLLHRRPRLLGNAAHDFISFIGAQRHHLREPHPITLDAEFQRSDAVAGVGG